MDSDRIWKIAIAVIIVVVVYVGVSAQVYAFRHPEMTDTQRLLHLGDALLWR